jgi:hypothetical protein
VIPGSSIAVCSEEHVERPSVRSDGALIHRRYAIIPGSSRLQKTVSVERGTLVSEIIRDFKQDPITPE